MMSEDEIHVYRLYPLKDDHDTGEMMSVLSGDEIDKAGRFKFIKDRNNFINCHSFLRRKLASYISLKPSEIIFSYTDKGKPYINSSQLKFNLSHSHGFGVFAFTLNDEIGIDTEKLREIPDALKISDRYFSEGEITKLRTVDSMNINKAFLTCWTRKEAFIKAVGDGLSYPLKDFEVSLLANETPEILYIKGKETETSSWKILDINLSHDHITSLAIRSFKHLKIKELKVES